MRSDVLGLFSLLCLKKMRFPLNRAPCIPCYLGLFCPSATSAHSQQRDSLAGSHDNEHCGVAPTSLHVGAHPHLPFWVLLQGPLHCPLFPGPALASVRFSCGIRSLAPCGHKSPLFSYSQARESTEARSFIGRGVPSPGRLSQHPGQFVNL